MGPLSTRDTAGWHQAGCGVGQDEPLLPAEAALPGDHTSGQSSLGMNIDSGSFGWRDGKEGDCKSRRASRGARGLVLLLKGGQQVTWERESCGRLFFFLFLSVEINRLAWKLHLGLLRSRSYPVLLAGVFQRPISKGKPPEGTPCPGSPTVSLRSGTRKCS